MGENAESGNVEDAIKVLSSIDMRDNLPESERAYLQDVVKGSDYTPEEVVGVIFIPREAAPNGRRLNGFYVSVRGEVEAQDPRWLGIYHRIRNEVEGSVWGIKDGLRNGDLAERMKPFEGKAPEFVEIGESFGFKRVLACYAEPSD